ncbi:hypothetical protein KGY79_11130 [Candidatus Bipolaricaulota bacterium]|nr:hypothetical protein [Candidatus Bipolaricaulota bacterium]
MRKAIKAYLKNFLRVSLPYVLLAGAYLGIGELILSKKNIWILIALFGAASLVVSGVTVVDIWGSINNLKFGLPESFKYVIGKSPRLIFTMLIVLPGGLVLLYLFLNFFSFYLFIPLAFYPFFFIYLLPILLLGEKGVLSFLRKSFDLAWYNPIKTGIITFLPAIVTGYLLAFGFQLVVFLFILPFWMSLIVSNYCEISECIGPVNYFNG